MDKPHTINDLVELVSQYLNEENIKLIVKAYDVAKSYHEGQYRKSGDPYIQHPLEVTYILGTLNAGPNTLCAGLLHDVLEDTDMTKEEMAAEFNAEVAEIVDGVTKISKLKYRTKEKALASNHEKLLIAMSKDIRVILVKLVDRLHNMRTIEFQPEDKRKRIAKETLDLYAPLAHRLGMYRLKAELEDLSFKAIDPETYHEISSDIVSKKSEREDDIEAMRKLLVEMLEKNNIGNYQIKGRIKNIYSIYKKIVTKNKTMDEILALSDFSHGYHPLCIKILIHYNLSAMFLQQKIRNFREKNAAKKKIGKKETTCKKYFRKIFKEIQWFQKYKIEHSVWLYGK